MQGGLRRKGVQAVVERQAHLFVTGLEGDVQGTAVRNDQGAHIEVVRGYGREYPHLGLRHHDGTAHTQGIGRGAAAGGDQQAVRPIGRKADSVHAHIHAEHRRALAEHARLIEGIGPSGKGRNGGFLRSGKDALRCGSGSRGRDIHAQQAAVFKGILAVGKPGQGFLRIVFREETDAAEIDA